MKKYILRIRTGKYIQTFDSSMLLAVSSSFQKASLKAFQFYDCYRYFLSIFQGFTFFQKSKNVRQLTVSIILHQEIIILCF